MTATTASITKTRMGTGPRTFRFAMFWKSGSALETGCAFVSCCPMPVSTIPMPEGDDERLRSLIHGDERVDRADREAEQEAQGDGEEGSARPR